MFDHSESSLRDEAVATGRRVSTNLPSGTALAAGCRIARLDSDEAGPLSGDVIVWECGAGKGEMDDGEVASLGERVRLGTSLLLTLDRNPGTTPMKLSFLSPTSGFETQTHFDDDALPGRIEVASFDRTFFAADEAKELALPFHYAIRPLATTERGQAKYERYRRPIQHLKDTVVGPNDEFWSKSLLNRERKIRVSGGDIFASPLLVSGLYGAGRVAIFASSGLALDAWEGGPKFWAAVLSWLGSSAPQNTGVKTPQVPDLAVETVGHAVHLNLKNPSSSALSVRVVGRASTWDGSLLGEETGELHRMVTIPPRGDLSVEMPLPEPSPTNYQALEDADAFQLRIGLLSADGSTILSQRRMALDFRSPVRVAVSMNNLSGWQYPFHAPGLDSLPLFDQRMGAQVSAYSYPPAGHGEAQVRVTNGLTNLAPLARIVDEKNPANASVEALNDHATIAFKGTADGVEGHGAWMGAAGDNVLSFTFAHPVTLTSVVLLGSDGEKQEMNPGAGSVELDGKRVASSGVLDADFVSGFGQARLSFAPAQATTLTLRLSQKPSKKKVNGMTLGEIRLEGWTGDAAPPASGTLSVLLVDGHSGKETPLATKELTLKAGASELAKIPFSLPSEQTSPRFYRVEARFAGVIGSTPVLAIKPPKPLLPRTDLRPKDVPSLGLIVSRGFRDAIPLGTGTQELKGGWGQPDDVIWCHAHQFNEIAANARSQANRLYLTEVTMGHYITPWRHFNNGVGLYSEAMPNFIAKMKAQPNWKKSDTAFLGQSDRWNAGPDLSTLHSWGDFVAFDDHLRASGKPGLTGRTRTEIAREIHSQHEDVWQAYQLQQYVDNVRLLRESFKAQGKDVVLSSQGVPMVAGAAGEELSHTIRGMSDDSTWGMEHNNIPATTGRQMSELAHNPVWKMNTLLQWGYDSSNLGNPIWHAPVGTTESSRRHCYNRAWRATIWPDGSYASMHTYGYNSNASVSFLMTENDWQQWWLLQERHSLLTPEEPIGAGLVISSSRYAGEHVRFTAAGNTFAESPEAMTLSRAFQRLHEAGLSMPFAANAGALAQWQGTAPLIILNLEDFSAEEVAILAKLQARGVRMVALTEEKTLPAGAEELFQHANATILQMPGRLSDAQARTALPQLQKLLDMPLLFPAGAAGYGFRMSGTSFLVVEDWLEQGRTASVRMRASNHASKATACNVNDHIALSVHRDGGDWIIEATLRPGDATLIALEEEA
jgi:hypothetical protein